MKPATIVIALFAIITAITWAPVVSALRERGVTLTAHAAHLGMVPKRNGKP